MQPIEFLETHNLSYKSVGHKEIAIECCPHCGDDTFHVYMDKELGLYHCKKCSSSGNLWTLKRLMGDIDSVTSVSEILSAQEGTEAINEDIMEQYISALMRSSHALNWLLGRGFTKETIHKFHLGLVEEGMTSWLAIPYYRDGLLVNIKHRLLPPHEKSFRLLPEHETPLFNIDNLNSNAPVYVAEGELDAMMLVQQGYENTVSIPLGAGTFLTEHFDALVVCKKIYLCYDSDVEGKKGAIAAAERLGPERCFYIKLPTKDINDFFLKHTKADFEAIIAESKTVGRSTVQSLSQVFSDMEATRSSKAIGDDVRFPWQNVDRIVGSLEPGWLIVLQAVPKIGKTTFCLNTCYSISCSSKPCLLFCLEMNPVRLLERVVSSVRGVPVDKLTDVDVMMAKAQIHKLPLYFGHTSDITPQKIYETIRYAVRRFGIRLVVFDHLHFLCRDINHSVAEVGHVIRSLKLLFEELNVPGIVIAHPKKMDLHEVPGLYAARESGEIAGDCDVLISLYRKPLGTSKVRDDDYVDDIVPTFEERTLVKVIASRFCAGGNAILFFDGDSMTFQES